MAKILIVDDDPRQRALLQFQLAGAGHLGVLAADATEAIPALLKDKFDLVVTDVEMPYLSGFELAEAVRADPKTLHIPVLLLTTRNDDLSWMRARMLGLPFLSKPVSEAAFLQAVEKALRPSTKGLTAAYWRAVERFSAASGGWAADEVRGALGDQQDGGVDVAAGEVRHR